MTVTLKQVANIISLVEKNDESHIIKTWYECDFTERKLKNAINKMAKYGEIKLV